MGYVYTKEYIWKKRLEKRKEKRKYERIILLILMLIIASFAIFSYINHTKSVEYTVDKLAQAVEKNDIQTIQKYVNLNSTIGKCYDDLTYNMFSYDNNLNEDSKIMMETFYKKVKPQLVEGSLSMLSNYISTGKITYPDDNDILKGRQLGIDYAYLIERAQIRNTHFIDVRSIKENGNSAEVTIRVIDNFTDTNYNLILTLEKNRDGVWQVIYINNYLDYLDKIEPLHTKDIQAYVQATQGIIDEYNNRLDNMKLNFRAMTNTITGELNSTQRNQTVSYVRDKVIPTLKARQEALDKVECPKSAQYLQHLRKTSSDLSIQYWQHFIIGIEKDSLKELNTSKALHKEAYETDNRINDILKRSAISKISESEK